MAAVAAAKTPSYFHFGGGRKDDYVSSLSYTNTTGIGSPVLSNDKSSILSSTNAISDEAGSHAASKKSSKQHTLRSSLRHLDTKMGSSTTTTTVTPTFSKRTDSLANLHKRGSSNGSLPASPAAIAAAQAQLYATHEEPFPDLSPTVTTNSTPKIKPYLRKMSSHKDGSEQGRLDLSKSVSETGGLAGLGIQDFANRSVSDGIQISRSISHNRNTSGGSQISTASGAFRPTQPFVHPMRPTPTRAYTPPTDASSITDEEARESSDVVPDDDVQPNPGLRGGRSMSLSSTPQIPAAPTPLSQTYTAADLGYVPKLTSASQSNLSVRSMKSSKSRLGRTRADTNRSVDMLPSPSSRTSLDRAVSFVSRRSDPDPSSRDERIRAARRKFEEKEANKDRKMETQAFKRRESELAKSAKKQERQRRQSGASEKPRIPKVKSKRGAGRKSSELQARRYDDSRITALPMHGSEPGKSEASLRMAAAPQRSRFSVWFQTRVLSCGGK